MLVFFLLLHSLIIKYIKRYPAPCSSDLGLRKRYPYLTRDLPMDRFLLQRLPTWLSLFFPFVLLSLELHQEVRLRFPVRSPRPPLIVFFFDSRFEGASSVDLLCSCHCLFLISPLFVPLEGYSTLSNQF